MSLARTERRCQLYAGMPISSVFKENIGIGGVISLLWFKRRLPDYALRFIEMVLMLTADHGPAVSGAHNTIVSARAGKDLVSSLCSGLLTIVRAAALGIAKGRRPAADKQSNACVRGRCAGRAQGDRFGGALDGAAEQFSSGYDKGLTPAEFVEDMRRQNKLILGIGHRVKSRNNPDLRVVIIKEFVKKHFPASPILDYAIAVEQVTTAKKDNLILNVDGAIGVAFVDLMRNSGCFTREEADVRRRAASEVVEAALAGELTSSQLRALLWGGATAQEYVKTGTLNGLFVVGRSIGFVGHFLDQKRLKQGLYRHPWDDISYLVGNESAAP